MAGTVAGRATLGSGAAGGRSAPETRKPRVCRALSGSGGGTRTPDTRIMIPLVSGPQTPVSNGIYSRPPCVCNVLCNVRVAERASKTDAAACRRSAPRLCEWTWAVMPGSALAQLRRDVRQRRAAREHYRRCGVAKRVPRYGRPARVVDESRAPTDTTECLPGREDAHRVTAATREHEPIGLRTRADHALRIPLRHAGRERGAHGDRLRLAGLRPLDVPYGWRSVATRLLPDGSGDRDPLRLPINVRPSQADYLPQTQPALCGHTDHDLGPRAARRGDQPRKLLERTVDGGLRG